MNALRIPWAYDCVLGAHLNAARLKTANDVAAADAQIDGPGGDREVWAVYLRDCDPDCLSSVGTQVVVLNAVTGELLYTNVPAAGGEAP